MSRLFCVVSALVTVLALGANLASSALASETEPVFLLNKAELTSEQEFEDTGELEIADTKAVLGVEAAVLCSPDLVGRILFLERDHVVITRILTLKGEEIGSLSSGVAAECANVKNCAEPLVFPVDLPWLGLLTFMAGHEWRWLLTLEEEGKGQPGWETECMSLKVSDTCTASASKIPGMLVENMSLGRVLATFLRAELEEEKLDGECTLGGKETFVMNNVEESGTIAPIGGGELEVS